MAINVPTNRERTVQQAAPPAAFQRSDAPSAAFGTMQAEAIGNAGTAAQRLGTQWTEKTLNIAKENNELSALNYQANYDSQLNAKLYDPENGILARKGRAALGADKEVLSEVQRMRAEFDSAQNVPQDVRNMMGKYFTEAESRYTGVAQRHGFEQYLSYKDETLQSQKQLNAETAASDFLNDKAFNQKFAENQELLKSEGRSKGWDEATLNLKTKEAYSDMRTAQFTKMIETNDPSMIVTAKKAYDEAKSRGQMVYKDSIALDRMMGVAVPKAAAQLTFNRMRGIGLTGQDEILDFVMYDLEGGAKTVSDGNGMAQYGINSAANPDLPVGKLTQEGARAAYKERYWNAIGADSLPDSMKLLAMNAAVLTGPTQAKKLIERSGNDPQKMLQLTDAFLNDLVKNNPEKYAKNAEGWNNRTAKIMAQFHGDISLSVAQNSAAALEKQFPTAGAELMELVKKSIAEKESVRKADETQVKDEVQKIVSENNGDWTQVPAILRAKAARHGIDITAYKGVSDPDIVMQLDAMDSNALFAADLTAPEFVQNLNFADRQKYMTKQKELAKPESKFLQDRIDSAVNYYFKAELKADPEAKKTKAKVALFRNHVSFAIEQLAKDGKPIDDATVNRVASTFIRNRLYDPKGLGKYDNIFTDLKMKDIPPAIRQNIEQSLVDDGEPVNEQSVLQRYMLHLRSQGQIQRGK